MTIDRFLEPRLSGAQLEDNAIPLEFLKDLAVLEEMVIEVAKAEFLKEHEDRQRSPRGFTEGVAFKLTGVEGGSARPVISLVLASAAALFVPDNQTYFERARDAIVGAIAAADANRPITQLPERTLSYFDRMGRSLRDGESMEFTIPGQNAGARLTKETRRKLLLASAAVTELTDETTVRGTVPEADQADGTFEVQLFDGRKIKGPIAAQYVDTIMAAFNGYRTGARILLQGVGRFDRNNRLLKLDSVEHASILDSRDVVARLDEFRQLRPGWLEGDGVAFFHQGLDWLARAFSENFPEELPAPYLYPTPEGKVRAEWSLGRHEISLEIDLNSGRAFWHDLNMQTDAEEERDVSLLESAGWEWLTGRIRESAAGGAA